MCHNVNVCHSVTVDLSEYESHGITVPMCLPAVLDDAAADVIECEGSQDWLKTLASGRLRADNGWQSYARARMRAT